jgi:hypothetical protein
MDSNDPRRIDLLAREIAFRIGERVSCSNCHDAKPENQTYGWTIKNRQRGLQFYCRGVRMWGCIGILSANQLINRAKTVCLAEVESIERGLFGRKSVGSEAVVQSSSK